MIKDFILPDIGEGVVECELVEWLVKEGDTVVEDQPIADVMTDKALVQIPAPFAGVVTKLYYAKGDIAKVHAPLYAVQIEGAVEIAGEESVAAAAATIAKAAEPVAVTNATTSSHSSVSIEEFLLPDIGEGIVECELVEWLVSEGDWVEEDQPIADVMTDKALVQIPAIKAGKIAKLHYRKGQLAKVHAPLFAIEVEQTASAPATTINTDTVANAAPAAQAVSAEPARQGKALASPAVRRMARSLDIDLSQVPGTGKHGRVYKEDITRFQQGASNVSAPSVAQVKETSVQATQASQTQVP
ncbi:MAG: biotin/lipoyl-containing protein, partial [Shewanella oncorhynchi]